MMNLIFSILDFWRGMWPEEENLVPSKTYMLLYSFERVQFVARQPFHETIFGNEN